MHYFFLIIMNIKEIHRCAIYVCKQEIIERDHRIKSHSLSRVVVPATLTPHLCQRSFRLTIACLNLMDIEKEKD